MDISARSICHISMKHSFLTYQHVWQTRLVILVSSNDEELNSGGVHAGAKDVINPRRFLWAFAVYVFRDVSCLITVRGHIQI
jgi:hypothetical protein